MSATTGTPLHWATLPESLRNVVLRGLSPTSPTPFMGLPLFVPDDNSVVVQEYPLYYEDADAQYYESAEQYNRAMSVTDEREAGIMGFSLGMSGSISQETGESSSEIDAYLVNSIAKQVYTATRTHGAQKLDPGFAAALAKLPATVDAKLTGYKDFFDTYGTHYLVNGSFGGSLLLQSAVTVSSIERYSETSWGHEVSATFKDVVELGHSLSTAASRNEWLTEHEGEWQMALYVAGGDFAGDKDEWLKTCADYATLLNLPKAITKPILAPISDLVTDPTMQDVMELALAQYLPPEPVPVIGDMRAVPVSHQTTAQSDGFLWAYLNIDDSGPRGYLRVIDEQGGVLATCSAHNWTKDERWARRASLFVPIPGQFTYQWTATKTSDSGISDASSAYMVDLNAGKLGSRILLVDNVWQPEGTPAVQKKADTDGFVLCMVQKSKDGDRCEAQLTVGSEVWAATSQHEYDKHDTHYPYESFCIPIPQGTTYTLTAKRTSGQPTLTASWIPLTGAKLCAPVKKLCGTIYDADKDGFLVAVLMTGDDGSRCSVQIQIGGTKVTDDQLRQSDKLAGTSIHKWTEGGKPQQQDTYLKFNTATVPIQKGQKYLLDYGQEGKSENPKLIYYFVPIEALG